ncbi:glutathione S-transferase N-terminal domain-containing protein [Patescibacteria group bacterium]|nr:glutathione S-transferase N-terminal domain-containing protein [Patescibacteria group bacterium]
MIIFANQIFMTRTSLFLSGQKNRNIYMINQTVELRNVNEAHYKKELVQGGGQSMVPCLKHPDGTSQHDSSDIADFIRKHYA